MSKKIVQEQIEDFNIGSQIFLETQEDFVFNRKFIPKSSILDYENVELGFDDWTLLFKGMANQ